MYTVINNIQRLFKPQKISIYSLFLFADILINLHFYTFFRLIAMHANIACV